MIVAIRFGAPAVGEYGATVTIVLPLREPERGLTEIQLAALPASATQLGS